MANSISKYAPSLESFTKETILEMISVSMENPFYTYPISYNFIVWYISNLTWGLPKKEVKEYFTSLGITETKLL